PRITFLAYTSMSRGVNETHGSAGLRATEHLAATRLKHRRDRNLVMRQLLITLSLVMLLALPVFTLAQDQSHPTYEVYALSYGVYPDFPVSALLAGADKTRKIDLQMMIWLIKSPGKNILVDTGCYHENVVKGKGIKDLIKASDAIAKLGLSAADITDVIITHMHWDHADGMD